MRPRRGHPDRHQGHTTMRSSYRLALSLSLLLGSGALVPAAFAQDASVKSRLDAQGIKYTVDEDGDYRVTYNYSKEGRTQLVFVGGKTESVAGFTIREVFAPAARVDKDGVNGTKALELLEHSRRNKFGSWEIAGGVLYFVIKLPDSVNGKQLEAAMDIVAEVADDMEIELSGDRDDL
jgi:hypothetical protein